MKKQIQYTTLLGMVVAISHTIMFFGIIDFSSNFLNIINILTYLLYSIFIKLLIEQIIIWIIINTTESRYNKLLSYLLNTYIYIILSILGFGIYKLFILYYRIDDFVLSLIVISVVIFIKLVVPYFILFFNKDTYLQIQIQYLKKNQVDVENIRILENTVLLKFAKILSVIIIFFSIPLILSVVQVQAPEGNSKIKETVEILVYNISALMIPIYLVFLTNKIK